MLKGKGIASIRKLSRLRNVLCAIDDPRGNAQSSTCTNNLLFQDYSLLYNLQGDEEKKKTGNELSQENLSTIEHNLSLESRQQIKTMPAKI